MGVRQRLLDNAAGRGEDFGLVSGACGKPSGVTTLVERMDQRAKSFAAPAIFIAVMAAIFRTSASILDTVACSESGAYREHAGRFGFRRGE